MSYACCQQQGAPEQCCRPCPEPQPPPISCEMSSCQESSTGALSEVTAWVCVPCICCCCATESTAAEEGERCSWKVGLLGGEAAMEHRGGKSEEGLGGWSFAGISGTCSSHHMSAQQSLSDV